MNQQPVELRIDRGVAGHYPTEGPSRIEVNIISDRRITAVGLRFGDMAAVGTARCHPNDRPVRELGENIALARALHAMARRLISDAQTRIDAPPRKVGGTFDSLFRGWERS